MDLDAASAGQMDERRWKVVIGRKECEGKPWRWRERRWRGRCVGDEEGLCAIHVHTERENSLLSSPHAPCPTLVPPLGHFPPLVCSLAFAVDRLRSQEVPYHSCPLLIHKESKASYRESGPFFKPFFGPKVADLHVC